MLAILNFRIFYLALLFGFTHSTYSQSGHTITAGASNEECTKGAAAVNIEGLLPGDALTITWSTGQTGVFSIDNLEAGSYYVYVKLNSTDTTINLKVTKEPCKVTVFNHFTPNDDGYNDHWQIGNWEFYPKFELFVFNKWGQQVHKQKGTYTPWDGTWNGIHVPDGTYYYVFYYEGSHKNHLVKGDVAILR